MLHRADQNCRACRHFRSTRQCRAFPEFIPDALWSGENLHREAYPGDQGYRYERRFNGFPDLTADQVMRLSGRGSKVP